MSQTLNFFISFLESSFEILNVNPHTVGKNKRMAAGWQKVVSCVVDETTHLKAKFARLGCKSLRQNSSPRFNTTSFSLVHSRKKLWSIPIFCQEERKKRKKEKNLCFCVFSSLQKDLLYSDLVEEENSNSIKQGSKTGVKTMRLERIMVLMHGGRPSQRGINLAVTPKIREVGEAPLWGAITLTIPD